MLQLKGYRHQPFLYFTEQEPYHRDHQIQWHVCCSKTLLNGQFYVSFLRFSKALQNLFHHDLRMVNFDSVDVNYYCLYSLNHVLRKVEANDSQAHQHQEQLSVCSFLLLVSAELWGFQAVVVVVLLDLASRPLHDWNAIHFGRCLTCHYCRFAFEYFQDFCVLHLQCHQGQTARSAVHHRLHKHVVLLGHRVIIQTARHQHILPQVNPHQSHARSKHKSGFHCQRSLQVLKLLMADHNSKSYEYHPTVDVNSANLN